MADLTTNSLIAATIAKVKTSYATAGATIWGLSVVTFSYDKMKSWVASTSQSQQAKDFAQLGRYIDDWATRRATWAARGTRDDGSAYGVDRWVAEGKQYAEDAWQRAGLAFDSSFFADAAATARGLVTNLPKDLADGYAAATSPTKWPWYLQAAVAGVGLFYASQIWANFRGRK